MVELFLFFTFRQQTTLLSSCGLQQTQMFKNQTPPRGRVRDNILLTVTAGVFTNPGCPGGVGGFGMTHPV